MPDTEGSVASMTPGAQLMVVGGPTLNLPWFPEEIEYSDLAPGYSDTTRPGDTTLQTRSVEPTESLRIPFTLSGLDLAKDSAVPWLSILREIITAKPLTRLVLGNSDRGLWRIVEAGYVENAHLDDGTPSSVDVVLQLRGAGRDRDPIGPIRRRHRIR